MPTSMMMYTLPSHQRYPSQGCALSSGAACTARARLRRAGRHYRPRPWRASGLPEVRPARAAVTMLSWTCGASCTATTSPSRGTTTTSMPRRRS
eukprot:7436296-Alexandrium_andersonii.AAC.1